MERLDGARVWDPFVRVFHWTLVAAFTVSFFTEGEPRWLHVGSGYLIGALVVTRIIWGFVGSKHARFKSFVRSPKDVLSHLWDVVRFRSRRYLGHDPAGGAMIVALLLCLLITVSTGLLLYGAHDNAGPFAGLVAEAGGEWGGSAGVQTAYASRNGHEHEGHKSQRGQDGESPLVELLEEVHEVMAGTTFFLVILHVLGVVAVSWQTKENLVRSMITGEKRPPQSGDMAEEG